MIVIMGVVITLRTASQKNRQGDSQSRSNTQASGHTNPYTFSYHNLSHFYF
tara:strand:+ start:401 stop:553 length:153 start_codon:yes stop_codon:yes gene_type:complete